MARPDIEALLAESGWLRSLCRNLIRDRHLAEDIEQQTWLAALHAETPRRNVLRRWLRAVVTNFARQSLRRRELPGAAEHPVEDVSSVPAPGSALERAEFRRTLVDAVLALDEPYRSTVILRFFEEQSFDQIAHDQGVPASTVRTRLQRGLERLRRRLEDEYQGGWASWASFLAGHEAAPAAAAAALGSTFLPLLFPCKFVLGAALVAGLVYVGWQAVPATPAPTSVAPGFSANAAEGASMRSEIAEPGLVVGTRTESRREPLAGELPSPSAPEASIRGRLLLESGAPATGFDVAVLAAGAPAQARSEHAARTAADGSFAIRFDPRPFSMFTLEIERRGHARERWQWAEIASGETRDIGEFTMRRGGAIEGRVVDANGAPLGAREWSILAEPAMPRPIPNHRTSRETGRTDPHTGSFRIEDLPPGRIDLTASTAATGRLRGPSVEVIAGETVHADIVYDGPDLARRVVLTVSTRPFLATGRLDPEHIEVHGAGAEPRHPVRLEGRSAWFAFDDLEDGVYSIEIDAPEYARWKQEGVVPGSFVRARVQGNAALDLRVVDRDGVPLTEFSVLARIQNVMSSRSEFVVHDGTEPLPDGRIPGFFPGDYTLTVEADGHGACTVHVDDLRAHENRELSVVVKPSRVLAGRVLFPDGNAAVGVDVVLVTPAAVDDSPSSPVLPPDSLVLDRARFRVEVDATQADDEGRFVFDLARQDRFLVYARRGIGIQVISPVVNVNELDEEDLVLTIARGATIAGRIWHPADCPGQGLRLVANPNGELDEHTRSGLQNRSTLYLSEEGTFELGPLPPGETELRLLLPSPPQADMHWGGRAVGGVVLGTVELRDGEDVERDFLLGQHRPVPVTLRLLVPEGSVSQGRLTLTPASDRYAYTRVISAIETGGTFGPVLLFPGEWKVRVEGVEEEWTYEHPSPLTVRAGAPNAQALSMELARGTLRLLDATTEEPLADRSFLLDGPGRDGFQARPLRTDADGRVEVVLQWGTYLLGLVPLDDSAAIVAERTVELVWTVQGPPRGDLWL